MRRNHLDRWGRRKHPNRYNAIALRAMLVDDIVHARPLGGPDEVGCAFTIGACDKIARKQRCSVDEAFQSILDEGESLTGRSYQVLG